MSGHFFLRGILELRPYFKQAKGVTILFDKSHTSKLLIQQIFKRDNLLRRQGIEIKYLIIDSFDDLKTQVKILNTKKSEQIFMGTLHSIKSKKENKKVGIKSIFKWVENNYHLPIFSFWHDTVGVNECLAAFGVDIKEQGIIAGKLANSILKKKNITQKIMTPDRGLYFFSKHQLKKYRKTILKKDSTRIKLLD